MFGISCKRKLILRILLLQTILQLGKAESEGAASIQDVLDKLTTDVKKLEDAFDHNNKGLADLQGFVNAVGIGTESFRDPCGNSEDSDEEISWFQLTASTCIKVLNGTRNMENAMLSCRNEFQSGHDIDFPRVLTLDSSEKQGTITQRLQRLPWLTAVWIHNENQMTKNFSTWPEESTTSFFNEECIELRNDQVGNWSGVQGSCLRENSVICEKTVSIPYAQLVQEQVNILPAFSAISANHIEILGIINDISTKQEQTARENIALHHTLGDLITKIEAQSTLIAEIQGKCGSLDEKVNKLIGRDVSIEIEDRLIDAEFRITKIEIEIQLEKELRKKYLEMAQPKVESGRRPSDNMAGKPIPQLSFRINGWNDGNHLGN